MRAVGFRVKSGFAIAVVLDGSRGTPRAVARHVVELCDPKAAETRQPYHHGFYTTESDAREIARRVRIVTRCAKRSITVLVEELGHTPAIRAALVVGSVIDPSHVANPHIRAHASEGRLFRTVLEEALRSHDVVCEVIVEKQLPARVAADLGRSPRSVVSTLAAFGRTLGSPWRADEKAAATAAWLSLGEA